MISRHYYFEMQNIAFAAHTKDCIISPQSLHSILTQNNYVHILLIFFFITIFGKLHNINNAP